MSLLASQPTDHGPPGSVWRSRDFRTCWMLSATFGIAWGVLWPLRNLYFRDPAVGLSLQQVGWLGFVRSATMASLPVLVGILSDGSGRRKPWIVWGFALSSVSAALYLTAHGFWSLAVVTFVNALAFVAYNLNVNALVTTTLHDHARGKQFGFFRVSGSIGYAVANFVVIPFVALDPTYAATFLAGAVIYLTCMIIALVRVREAPAREGAPSHWGAWREVLAERNLVVLYVFMAVSSIGTSMGMQFMANHLDETFHLSKPWIGRVIGLAAVIEIPALILLGRASDRWGRKPVLVFAFIVGGVRWILVGMAPHVGWVAVAQVMWGLGFAGYTVSVALITDLVKPAARGSAMGMLQLSWAFGSIIGPPIGGYIAQNIGLPVVFRVGGGFAILGGIGLLFMLRAPDAAGDTV
ncbi:hypothetical protein CMK11_19550 [Candidatus Poribacteria bacterium]|nr:hypothetical protein [Candidatus Poribacteria bacterium]